MTTSTFRRASALRCLCMISWLLFTSSSFAHSFNAGELLITHPYSVPSRIAAKNGVAYIRGISNRSDQTDKLLSASTPVAATVEIHTMKMDGDVMRMREIGSLPLPPKTEIFLRHDERGENGYHLMLMNLNRPLNVGDRFPMVLKFEKAGSVEVEIVVQSPKSEPQDTHKH